MKKTNKNMEAFLLGVFAGELLISKGCIQPDFQVENVGIRNGIPVLMDYADIIGVELPAALTRDVIRIIKESIFSLVDNYEGSFEAQSYVRAGFLARSGMLGHMVYEDARDNGYSSFLFVEKSLRNTAHSLGRITKWEDVKPLIGEWIEIPLDLLNVQSDLELKQDKEKKTIHPLNGYYLQNIVHIMSLLDHDILGDEKKCAQIYADICISALRYGMPYMAYGYAQKCLTMASTNEILSIGELVINETHDATREYKNYVDKFIELEDFQFMWILEDFDITI